MITAAFTADRGRASVEYGSSGFSVTALARVDGSLACLRLEPDGLIGRHRAAARQLFAVVAGAGTVSGADGMAVSISAGQAALWEAGELHETRSADGLTAIVAEGEAVELWSQAEQSPLR